MIGQVILGMGCYTVLITGYVIVSELTEEKFKQYSIISLNVIWYEDLYLGLFRRY